MNTKEIDLESLENWTASLKQRGCLLFETDDILIKRTRIKKKSTAITYPLGTLEKYDLLGGNRSISNTKPLSTTNCVFFELARIC